MTTRVSDAFHLNCAGLSSVLLNLCAFFRLSSAMIRSFWSRLINSSVLSVFPLHPVCTIHAQTASDGVRIGEPAETINECS